MGFATTTFVYLMIFIMLKRRKRNTAATSARDHGKRRTGIDHRVVRQVSANIRATGSYYLGFLIYPIIYMVCKLPVAMGRAATMAGSPPSAQYFAGAGFLMACNGWLDTLVWGFTRRKIVFGAGAIANEDALGLDTFTFRWGNLVWIQAAPRDEETRGPRGLRELAAAVMDLARRGRPAAQRGLSNRKMSPRGEPSGSQALLRENDILSTTRGDMVIHMNTVTTVVVEEGVDTHKGEPRRPEDEQSLRAQGA